MNVWGNQTTFCRDMGVLSVWQTGCPITASPGLTVRLSRRAGAQLFKPWSWSCTEADAFHVTHKSNCEKFKSKGNSLVQAISPEDDSGTGRSVNVTKPTDSLRGDWASTSAHPSWRKQNRLEDVQEDPGCDECWHQFRSGSAINCIPLPSPGRNTPELGVFVQDPCAEHSREVAQGGERRWWFWRQCLHEWTTMTVLRSSCVADTTSARNWHTSQENMNVFKEALPACLAFCTELGNREDDPTDGIQSLSLTLNNKHRAYMKTPVTFAQVTAEHHQVRNATLRHQQTVLLGVLVQNGQAGPHHLANDMVRAQQGGWLNVFGGYRVETAPKYKVLKIGKIQVWGSGLEPSAVMLLLNPQTYSSVNMTHLHRFTPEYIRCFCEASFFSRVMRITFFFFSKCRTSKTILVLFYKEEWLANCCC